MSPGAFSLMRPPDGHTVIVGGGVIGICCAYFLAKRGARVTVLERDQVGKGASYGNAGSIAPGHTPVNKPGRVRQALKSLFDPLRRMLVPSVNTDASIDVGPGIGEDAAVIDAGGPELLVATTDPITFAAKDVGRYLLAVNANDLGLWARWLLVTMLLQILHSVRSERMLMRPERGQHCGA